MKNNQLHAKLRNGTFIPIYRTLLISKTVSPKLPEAKILTKIQLSSQYPQGSARNLLPLVHLNSINCLELSTTCTVFSTPRHLLRQNGPRDSDG